MDPLTPLTLIYGSEISNEWYFVNERAIYIAMFDFDYTLYSSKIMCTFRVLDLKNTH